MPRLVWENKRVEKYQTISVLPNTKKRFMEFKTSYMESNDDCLNRVINLAEEQLKKKEEIKSGV